MVQFIVKKGSWAFYKPPTGRLYHKTTYSIADAAKTRKGHAKYVQCGRANVKVDGHFTLIPPEGSEICKDCFWELNQNSWTADPEGFHSATRANKWPGSADVRNSDAVDGAGTFSYCPVTVEVKN